MHLNLYLNAIYMLLVVNYRLGCNQPMGGQLEPLVFADLGNPASPFPSFIALITYPYFILLCLTYLNPYPYPSPLPYSRVLAYHYQHQHGLPSVTYRNRNRNLKLRVSLLLTTRVVRIRSTKLKLLYFNYTHNAFSINHKGKQKYPC